MKITRRSLLDVRLPPSAPPRSTGRCSRPRSRRTRRCASAFWRRAPALPRRPASTASAPRNGRSSSYNANGGIAGRKVELVIEEESSPKDTIERFSKLVQQEKVDCVQGIVSSGVGLALGPVVEEAKRADDLLGRHDAERRRRDDSRSEIPVPRRPTTNAKP